MARKILLADDSVTAQNMGRKILTDAGYEVVTVNNGSAALKKILECRPSLVVLDVYMPGYSGLEVCARIKEGRDTEGIPVLLTVGKLEPFRQEDARKVRADAFIIKPFEATELLAALSKLETNSGKKFETSAQDSGKSAEDAKTSRPVAATMDRYEREVADAAPRFGDQESGWKARLTMPAQGARREEPQQVSSEITGLSPARCVPGMDSETHDAPAFTVLPPSETTASLPGLPNDVTPDELAAIAAAAEAVGGRSGAADVEAARPESFTFATSSDVQSSAPVTFANTAAQQPEPPYAATMASAGPVSAQVEAVLTSLAAARSADASGQDVRTPPASTAVPVSNPLPAPARWVAEEVPIEPAESALVLEREMHKAFAAFAAAEKGASYEPGPVDKNDEPIFAKSAPPAIGTPTPFASSPRAFAEITPVEDSNITTTAPSVETPQVSAEIAKAPAMPFAPVTSEETKHAVVAFGEPHPFAAEGSTHADEAGPEQRAPISAQPQRSLSEQQPVPPSNEWHELRQAPVNPPAASTQPAALEQFASEEEAAKLEDKIESAAMAAAAAGDSSSAGPADSSLSNIVDSMLAELKPRLMAELAKKLEKK